MGVGLTHELRHITGVVDSRRQGLWRMNGSSVSKQRFCFEVSSSFSHFSNMVKLAQKVVRELLVCVVSLSFLNLFCVNVDFAVKHYGAVGL